MGAFLAGGRELSRDRYPRAGLGAALFADGAVHAYWATGAVWPAQDEASLSSAVLGLLVPFSPGVVLPLAGLLWVCGGLILLGGRGTNPLLLRVMCRAVTMAVTVALATRAGLGVLWATGIDGVGAPEFFWVNLLVSTPLSVLLAWLGWRALRPTAPNRGPAARTHSARTVTAVLPMLMMAGLLYGAYGFTPAPQRNYDPQRQLGAVPSRFVDTPVARFHYIVAGTGSPVVLLSPGSAWVVAWLPQFEALAAEHTVYVVDLPGQGFTELHDRGFEFDLEGMTSAIDTFLDAMGLPQAALGGNSWSGGWALAYAQQHPDRVTSLVLLAPSGMAEPDPLSWELLKLPVVGRALTHASAGSRAAVADGVRSLFAHQDRVTPGLIDAMWAPGTLPDNLRATYELERALDWRITEAELPSTRQPTLVIWGLQDGVLPPAQGRRLAALLPDADLRLLDGCGHALTLDCSEQTRDLITGFLRGR